MAFQYSVLFLGAFSQQASHAAVSFGGVQFTPGRSGLRRALFNKGFDDDVDSNAAIGLFSCTRCFCRRRQHAQFTATPFSDPATGERYHIEASLRWWNPPPRVRDRERDRSACSARRIDAVADLGIAEEAASASCASCCGPRASTSSASTICR